jgi:hypothetical protein
MLTSPYQEGDRTYIVASRGGDDHNPAWFLNLVDNPDVTVSVQGGPAQKMRAEVAGSDERARDPPRCPYPCWELRMDNGFMC